MRAVSELVAASLLALIAIAVGGVVLAMFLGYLQLGGQSLEREALRAEVTAAKEAAVAAAYVDSNGVLHVYLSVGGASIVIHDVYVNGTLYDDKCTVSYNETSPATLSLPNARLPPYVIAEVSCTLPSPSPAEVRIVYDGGALVAYASPV